MSGLKQLGVILAVGAMAIGASAQRPWGGGKPERDFQSRQSQQQQRSTPQRESRQQNRQASPPPVQPKALVPGRGVPNPDSQQPAPQAAPRRRGDWLRNYGGQSPQEQQKSLENDPAFKALAPQDQERLKQRLNWFNNLPPERRERVIRRHEIIENMTPDQRTRARDLFQRFRNLPESRRKVMDFYFRNLRNMPPEEQQQVMGSSSFKAQFSDEEQNIMRGMTELNLGPRSSEGGPPDD